jgi:two-component system sensor histidine kinase CpxA
LVLVLNALNPALASKQPGTMKLVVTFLPVITLIVGGLFCYLITRHITSPLVRLQKAAAGIARGNLDTRVSPALGRRRDEIAALGRDFDRMAERVETLLAGQKRLLGDVSHELRSPLSRLVVALGLAKKAPSDQTSEHLARIELEAHRLDNLIGQLLTLSRIDSGGHATANTSFDLANLVHEVASDADFEARAHSRNVVVTAADDCAITGSEEVLRSAIENVVRNAARYTREGTTVEVSLSKESEKAVLLVRDHGPGVPEEMLKEIFLPFRRAPASDETASEGAGLGLAIAQRAVTLHGGTIRAMNAADGGLIVEVELSVTSARSGF